MTRIVRLLGLSALVLAGIFLGAGLQRTAEAYMQPNMHAALNSLNTARAYLNRATADKAGHRVQAMRYVDMAIQQTHLGIAAGMR